MSIRALILFTLCGLLTPGALLPNRATAEQPPAMEVETRDDVAVRPQRKPGLRIQSRYEDNPWRTQYAVYPIKGHEVELRVRHKEAENIRWYLIFADITKLYNNANPLGTPNAYAWRGIDPIDYYRVEIPAARGRRVMDPVAVLPPMIRAIKAWFERDGDRYETRFYNATVGTFWFQVEADVNAAPFRSLGIEDLTPKGISPKVFRLSIREDDGYLGWVTSLYNVPGVFGSVLYQSRHYIGADCADLLMSAWSKWRHRRLDKNYNVQMLLTKFRQVKAFRIDRGKPDVELKWNSVVKAGDMIAVRYGDYGKKFHHIGALYQDKNGNGILDSADLVLHAGPEPLHLSPLAEGGFDGHIIVLRP